MRKKKNLTNTIKYLHRKKDTALLRGIDTCPLLSVSHAQADRKRINPKHRTSKRKHTRHKKKKTGRNARQDTAQHLKNEAHPTLERLGERATVYKHLAGHVLVRHPLGQDVQEARLTASRGTHLKEEKKNAPDVRRQGNEVSPRPFVRRCVKWKEAWLHDAGWRGSLARY